MHSYLPQVLEDPNSCCKIQIRIYRRVRILQNAGCKERFLFPTIKSETTVHEDYVHVTATASVLFQWGHVWIMLLVSVFLSVYV